MTPARPRTLPAASLALVAWTVLAPARVGAAPGPPPDARWVVDRVRFEPVDPQGTLVAEGTGEYRGILEVAPGGGGLATVNELGVEDYLRGIAEVPPTWPAEALKAQAIAARTYALHEADSKTPTPYREVGAHLCATDACQVYTGMAHERQPGAEGWMAAVAATKGQVLLYKGKPLLAEYSSSNGGRTAAGGEPYLKSVPDPDDAASPLSHWHYAVPLSALAPVLGVAPPVTLVAVSGGGGQVTFTTQAPNAPPAPQSVAGGDFRARVNAALPAPAGLPSALPTDRFSVSTQGGSVVFDGGGWGHGVGMSQYGALGKARRGMSAPAILAAYYGGIRPSPLPPDQGPPAVRVAVALGQGSVSVSAPGRFRVTDGAGHSLAELASGRWRVVGASKGKVRLIPPPGSDQPLALAPLALEPAPPSVGDQVTVRFLLSSPARVRVTVAAAGAGPLVLEPKVLDAGEAAEVLPPVAQGGDAVVTVDADAGAGRTATLPVAFQVVGPPGGATGVLDQRAMSPSARSSTRRAVAVGALGHGWHRVPTGVAASLLVLVDLALLGTVRSSRPGR